MTRNYCEMKTLLRSYFYKSEWTTLVPAFFVFKLVHPRPQAAAKVAQHAPIDKYYKALAAASSTTSKRTNEDGRQSLVVSQNNPRHRRFRHNSSEAGSAHAYNLPGVSLWGILGQSRQQRIGKNRLSEGDEQRGAEVLAESDESGTDGELVFGEVGLDCCDGLLQDHASRDTVQELIADPGRNCGGWGEGAHETGCNC